MRTVGTAIWNAWSSGGPFIGDDSAPHTRVTVEPDWYLTRSGTNVGTWRKGPARWFQREDNSQVEVEVPNIKRVVIDRSIDTDAATCTITLANQWMNENLAVGASVDLGNPGYFTFDRGSTEEARARWDHSANQWSSVLVPVALLRTYQGFGGKTKTITDALTDGNVVITGVWLVDEITVNAHGDLDLKCRDMARLLIDQKCHPPLIPAGAPDGYPLHRCRWIPHSVITQIPPQQVPSVTRSRRYERYGGSAASGSDIWRGAFNGNWYGHVPTMAIDGDPNSWWVSVGNGQQTLPYAVEWMEVRVGEEIDAVWLDPMSPNAHAYTVYISVWEGSGWVNGSGGALIDYDPLDVGRYTGVNTARIPWVWKGGVHDATEIRLPRKYACQKYRVTMTTLHNFASTIPGSADDPHPWRAGIRHTEPRMAGYVTPGRLDVNNWQEPGNYFDYVEIIKDLLLWSGWWLYQPVVTGEPNVFGNLETTGAWADKGCLDEEYFDKKPVIEVINSIKEIVGYLFYIDDEGGARFESPNWWASGNFNEAGQWTAFIPEIDEALQLTDYSVVASGDNYRTEIIVANSDPDKNINSGSTITARFRPEAGDLLRGIERSAMWIDDDFKDAAEMQILAELVAMQLFFQQRVGNVSCAANPAIQINDQVRIFERTTGETNIHYVRGLNTQHDIESGVYTMTLTTHWLGSDNDWVITRSNIPGEESTQSRPRWALTANVIEYIKRYHSRAVTVSRLSN